MEDTKLFQNVSQKIVGRKINLFPRWGMYLHSRDCELRVLSKGMVSFHLKLKAPLKIHKYE